MLNKQTFFSDDGLNRFFAGHSKDGESIIYIVKFIIVTNSLTKQQEYHMIYSDHASMKGGQHMRKGAQ